MSTYYDMYKPNLTEVYLTFQISYDLLKYVVRFVRLVIAVVFKEERKKRRYCMRKVNFNELE